MREYIENRVHILGVPKDIEVRYEPVSKQLRINLSHYYINSEHVDEDVYHAVREWLKEKDDEE